MSERDVPAFYPDFQNADNFKAWDGSPQAEAWRIAQEERDRAVLTAAGYLRRAGGDDIGGLMATLYSMNDDEIMDVVHEGQEQVEAFSQSSARHALECFIVHLMNVSPGAYEPVMKSIPDSARRYIESLV